MAELKNSRRISYKATYNQTSPTATLSAEGAPVDPTKTLMRAVEKTAFVQSLRIIPEELGILQKTVPPTAAQPAAVATALQAIQTLISDKTGLSTINNAAAFAKVDPLVLVAIANALVGYRQTVLSGIDQSIANVVSAYRNSLSPAAPPAAAAAPFGAAGIPAAKPPSGATTQSSMTDSGLAVLTTVTPHSPVKPAGIKPSVESRGSSIQVRIDESTSPPAQFSSVLAMSSAEAYTPANSDAIAWAEKYQPDLFSALAGALQPYTGLTLDERTVVGDSNALSNVIRGVKATFDGGVLGGVVAGFQSRMTIEPVGNLHLERIEMYPAGVERGELVHSVPLAPGETVNISHKEWSVTEKEFEDIVQDSFEGYSEQGVAEKNDIAMSTDSQSQHATALNVGASLSASYGTVTLSTNFGYNATSNDSQSKKDSRDHSMEITKKASARTKKEHKVSFKVTSVAGSEDQSVRVISNLSPTDTMRIDYFQLARKWRVDLLRYGLRMTYDIVIPNPGSGIVTLVNEVATLNAMINTPFTFNLPLNAIYYNSLATDPHDVSNYDQLAAQYNATVTAPPDPRKWVNVHKETAMVSDSDYSNVHFDSIDFDIDESYYVYQVQMEVNFQTNVGETNDYLLMIGNETIQAGAAKLIGLSGHLSLDFMYQYVYNYAINITLACRPKVSVLLDWRLQAWNQIRSAAQDQYNASVQNWQNQSAAITQQIADFDALTLRRMEQEEIMKGVLRWLLGPQFYLVPFDIGSLFGPDSNDPDVQDVLDPNQLTNAQWLDVMEHGEFIKYIHNAIEWENVLYFTYPYFWDDQALWDFKKFLYHPDPTHRMFLRSGAARVVLTIRPGFESSFTALIESGAFNSLPGPHPYVTIAQEIEDFANTNYPGFPPANPEQDARPLLYLEQRRVWREMQFIIQLINACQAATGAYPPGNATNTVPVAALTPFLDGPIVVNGASYNGVNGYNTDTNNRQLALDPTTPQDGLLPTYTTVPSNDLVWNQPYFYKCPGDTADYDLICYGADHQPGGADKNADISASCQASLISTWYEYTPLSALDIGVTTNAPNVVPGQPSPEIG